MSDALEIVPKSQTVSTGVRDSSAIANALSDVLADTYRLVFKTHSYHWNVQGPLFFSVHNLTEGQYANMFEAADELAERIRALGHLAPRSLDEIMEKSRIKDTDRPLSAGGMINDLATDHEKVAHRLHALAELSGGSKDIVTEDMATARAAFHEKSAWMLRSLSTS